MSPMVMHKRKCGMPRAGLYAVGEVSEKGTLNAFTALAAPLEAHITNPRAAEHVHMRSTLLGGFGLARPGPGLNDEPFAQLPLVGMADLWGKASGYKTVWDVIEETLAIGIARRIPAVPKVTLPCPLLMLHMEALVYGYKPGWLDRFEDFVGEVEQAHPPCDMQEQSWRHADSLGRVGDDSYMWHPYVAFWRHIGQMKPKECREVMDGVGARLEQAVFGLSWITSFVEVLAPDQDAVKPAYAQRGVLPAYAPDDPRAQEVYDG